jgi:hypothetical protein
MSSAEDDEVTQVAPPQLVAAARSAVAAADRTEDLPAPPQVVAAARAAAAAADRTEDQPVPPHLLAAARAAGIIEDVPVPPYLLAAARAAADTESLPAPPLLARADLPDEHDFPELTGPTQVSTQNALPRAPSADPEHAELHPSETTGELPAPPRAGDVVMPPELLESAGRRGDLSGPTRVVLQPGQAPRHLLEPTYVAEPTDVAVEPTDVGTAPTQVAALPHVPARADASVSDLSEELTEPVAGLLAAQAARAPTALAPAPAVVARAVPIPPAPGAFARSGPAPVASRASLRDLPDLPDMPDVPDVPEPPTPPPLLERPPSGPMPAATQAERPTAKIAQMPAAGASLAESGMRQEEITRGHAFIKLLVVIIGVSGSLMFVIDGDPVAEAITGIGLVYTLGAFAWFLFRVRDVGGYRLRPLIFLIVSTILAAYTMVFLWGPISPMPVIFALAIAFLAHSANARVALSGYLACALAQLGLTLLLGTGLVRDRSLIPLASLGTAEILVSQFVVHGMYFSAFLVARYYRRVNQQALAQLERAAVEVARRDLLLQEARQELSNALRVGSAGRYTGQAMGRFRLGVLLGHGAVGEVYEAADLETGGVAAIKLLHGHATSDERQVQRFMREAEHASRLRSPHVVRVFDYGHAPDGSHFLAMERLRGSNLAEHLRVYERMPLGDVVTLVDHVGAGLQAAWDAGIVHRDIKPQNIFRSQEPHGPAIWKILDFGVSKMANQNTTLTQGNIIGTPSYMAPEQVEGRQLDHRADLFALAAVAYRALTGRPAFGGDKLPVVLYRVVYGMPEAPSSMVAVPADVDLVFARALAKRPEDRHANAAELARSLALAARGQLTDSMRTQARALLRRHPWGTLLRPQEQRSSRSA